MTVKLNPGQLAAITAAIAGETLTATQARNLVKRGLVTAAGEGAWSLTDEGRASLALVEAGKCPHDKDCTLEPEHLGDHVDANGYRSLNWHDPQWPRR